MAVGRLKNKGKVWGHLVPEKAALISWMAAR
jgi:hypothetical protein